MLQSIFYLFIYLLVCGPIFTCFFAADVDVDLSSFPTLNGSLDESGQHSVVIEAVVSEARSFHIDQQMASGQLTASFRLIFFMS